MCLDKQFIDFEYNLHLSTTLNVSSNNKLTNKSYTIHMIEEINTARIQFNPHALQGKDKPEFVFEQYL